MLHYNGKCYRIKAKPYEPERQTFQIAWALIKNPGMTPQKAYLEYFKRQREEAQILYPSFRKDDN